MTFGHFGFRKPPSRLKTPLIYAIGTGNLKLDLVVRSLRLFIIKFNFRQLLVLTTPRKIGVGAAAATLHFPEPCFVALGTILPKVTIITIILWRCQHWPMCPI